MRNAKIGRVTAETSISLSLELDGKGESKIESMVTGVENGNRSFKIFIAPPQGVSYAKDIAEKYGVTFNSIKGEIDKRK